MHVQSNGGWLGGWLGGRLGGWVAGRPAGRNPPPPALAGAAPWYRVAPLHTMFAIFLLRRHNGKPGGACGVCFLDGFVDRMYKAVVSDARIPVRERS